MNRIVKFLEQRPGLAILASFLTIILAGTAFLMLPWAAQDGIKTGFIDALFTATSAVCVTGLIVKDTATHFSQFGQMIILCLIELGKLTIIIVCTNIFISFTRIKDQLLEDATHTQSNKERKKILITSISFMFAIEFFIFLHLHFGAELEYFDAIFHAISASANAGFSTYSNSLINFSSSLIVMIPVMMAIVMGGLGFPIWRYFLSIMRLDKEGSKYKHYSIVVSIATLFLIFIGFILIYASEGFGGKQEIIKALFQSITARTAGFHTIALDQLSQTSHLVLMLLMFIGGAWGSSAGGIKVFTFIILILFVYSFSWKRKNNELIILNRSIPEEFIRSVFLIVTLSILTIFTAVLILTYTERETLNIVLFEVVSAFNNVGLTLGLTGRLSFFGKILVILLMLFGKIGPLTLILKTRRKVKKSRFNYPKENQDNLLV